MKSSYNKETLARLRHQSGVDAQVRSIEDTRCASDRLYAMFRRPETVLSSIVSDVLSIVTTKYSPDLQMSRLFRTAADFLTNHPRPVYRPQLYFVIAAICRDSEVATMLNAPPVFVERVREGIATHQHERFGETDIEHRIVGFLVWAEMIYLTTTEPSLA